MTIAFSTAAADARLTQTYNATTQSAGVSVNGNASAGQLIIGTSSLALPSTGVLATITLDQPPFSIATKVATLLGVPLVVTPSGSGTAALAIFVDGGGNAVVTGLTVTATGGGGNIQLTTTTLSTSIPVSMTSGTITSP